MAYSYKKTGKKGTVHALAASAATTASVYLASKDFPPEVSIPVGAVVGGLIICLYDFLKKKIGLKLP